MPLTYVWYESVLQVASIGRWDVGGPGLLRELCEQQRIAAQDRGRPDASRLRTAIESVRRARPDV